MSKKIRLGLVGAGGISGAHVRGILANQDKVECAALCDVSEENLAARARQLAEGGAPAPALFRDWKALLAEGAVDAVDICLPHHLHAPAILDAAAAGRHILCEKPMCLDLDEADRIVAAVRAAGVTYMSAHNQLFKPSFQEIKRLLDSGLLGRVFWIRSQDCFRAPKEAFQGKWRADRKLQGGGELIDTGYHPSYRLLHLAGSEVEAVRAVMGRFVHGIQGEDTALVQVRFANSLLGEVATSWAFPRPHGTHEIHVVGEQGELFGTGNRLWHLPAGFSTPSERVLPEVDEFAAEIGHFADAVRNGTRPIHAVEEGRAVLRVILEASRDAEGWQKAA